MKVQITNEELKKHTRLFEVETTGIECNNETAASLRDPEIIGRFERSIEQEGDGHYKVMLPWNGKRLLLRSNYAQAKVRLEQIERKLKRDPAIQKEYQEAIQKYETEGTSEECPCDEITPKDGRAIYYVPHHVVIRPERETTKYQQKLKTAFHEMIAQKQAHHYYQNLLASYDVTFGKCTCK